MSSPGDSLLILVIDSGAESADWVCQVLAGYGFVPRRAGVRDAPRLVAVRPAPAAAVIDLGPPGRDGHDSLGVLGQLRAAGAALPVLALSALGHADERVRVRRAGADAILTKPLAAAELVLRLRELLVPLAPAASVAPLRCGDLTLDPVSGRVERAGRRLELTPRECALLEQLLRHRDEVVSRTVLLEKVWNYRFDPHASLIDTHVSRLRRKIDDGFPRPLLHTRRRVGYKLSENP